MTSDRINLGRRKQEGAPSCEINLRNRIAIAMMLHQREETILSGQGAALAQLHAIVDAWEALPGGRQVRNHDVEQWLAKDMGPAINTIRGFLRRARPDGIVPNPPASITTLEVVLMELLCSGAQSKSEALAVAHAIGTSLSCNVDMQFDEIHDPVGKVVLQ